MKKLILTMFTLISILGYSQQTKKKVYKKKPVKKSYSTKKVVKKSNATTSKAVPEIKVAKITEVEEPIKKEIIEISQPVKEEKADYITLAEKISKKTGSINNRNSVLYKGVEAYIKGVYSGSGKIYFLVEVQNRSNIPYEIESISFNSPEPIVDKNIIDIASDRTKVEELNFIPIWDNRPDKFERKSKNKIVFVFDKFTISDKRNLVMLVKETEGERELELKIKNKFLNNAEYIK